MSDDYLSTIANLETARDALATAIGSLASQLASQPIVPSFSESGDGGSESIDTPGMRAQLVAEITEKGKQIRELSVTIASLQAGINVKRIGRCRRFWPWR